MVVKRFPCRPVGKSDGRKNWFPRPSQSPAVAALPKGRGGRICIDTLHSALPLRTESRMVKKRHPLPLPSAARTEQITATSIGKCWHLRRQMTSRGRKALSVTCGDSSPKGRAKASYIGTRNGAYLYRYAPFTVLRLPLNARAARKSDGRKTVSVRHLASPCGRGGQPQRGRKGK